MPKVKSSENERIVVQPHHILAECNKSEVAVIKIHDIKRNELQEFEPVVKLETIRQWIMAHHPAGDYSVVGYDVAGKRLPGSKVVTIFPNEVAEQDKGEDPNVYYFQAQHEAIAEEKRKLEDIRLELQKQQDVLMTDKESLQRESHTNQIQMMLGFLKAEKEADRDRRDRDEELRRAHETRMRELEQSFTERLRKQEIEHEQKKKELEEERHMMQQLYDEKQTKIQEYAIQLLREESQRKMEEAERLHRMEVDQLKNQMQSQLEIQQKMIELRLAEQEAELKKKYKPDLMANLPMKAARSISEKAVERIVDAEYPEKTKIERVFEQITGVISQLDEKMPTLSNMLAQSMMKKQGNLSLQNTDNIDISESDSDSFDLDQVTLPDSENVIELKKNESDEGMELESK